MAAEVVRKQISIFLPLADWRALRDEAARRHIPITDLCRQWLSPQMEKLRAREADDPMAMPNRSVQSMASH